MLYDQSQLARVYLYEYQVTGNVFYKLGAYTGEAKYIEAAEAAVAPLQRALAQAPTEFAWL